ncbi:hypothetical protein NQ314_011825 [Rhamnusium bicolor]|uniref:C2H2-type domain-containing protein n=1 Tax=Rhamnusium bicolor TaxID=1586634 RepID=A0AAV8XFB0_9CUCU|nr:hypothetical protein NQ314_011825 [Rhamnusium bicolor]
MFSSVLSLQDHVNRRVIVLKYNCAGCSNEIFTFYNRCSFLLHTRKHYGLNEGKINLCELDIFTLPVSLAGFLPHPNIPLLYDVLEEAVPADTYINSQFYSPNIGEKRETNFLKQICSNIPKCEFVTVEHQRLLRRQNLFAEENNNLNNSMEIKQEPEEPVQPVVMPVISKVESLREKMFKLPRCLDCNAFQKGTMAEHYLGKEKPVDDTLKCHICRFVASTKCSLKAHVRIHESVPPFVCPDCGKDFPSWLLLRNHMDDVCFHLAKHAMHMNVCKYGRPFVSVLKLNLEDLVNRSFSSNSSDLDSSSSPTKFERVKRHISSDSSKTDDSVKRRRKRVGFPGSSKHRRNDKEVELDLTAEEPMQFDGTYHCKLCDYKNTDRSEFHGHIKEHRDISTAYQCMECAECFVVKPSLIKHLLHFHNIFDHQTYLKENDCYDVDAVRELEDTMKLAPGESKEPVKENQCRVCRQEFEDSIALNKHFRIHGMAFLLRNTK